MPPATLSRGLGLLILLYQRRGQIEKLCLSGAWQHLQADSVRALKNWLDSGRWWCALGGVSDSFSATLWKVRASRHFCVCPEERPLWEVITSLASFASLKLLREPFTTHTWISVPGRQHRFKFLHSQLCGNIEGKENVSKTANGGENQDWEGGKERIQTVTCFHNLS